MKYYKYDVALSFAGENRNFAEVVAKMLRSQNVEVFYDKFNAAELWGEDLSVEFRKIYSVDSQYCIMILSDYYIEKVWPRVELKNAIEKGIQEKGEAYILPVRLDDFSGEVPGLSNIIGYISASSKEPEKVVNHFLQKIRIAEKKPEKDTIELIQEEVSKFFNVTVKDLKSGRKQKRVSEPRQIAMFLSRKYTSSSFPEIGSKFGGENHSTVVHAAKNIEKKIKEDPDISDAVSNLSLQIKKKIIRKS